jgi:hypothetical protein
MPGAVRQFVQHARLAVGEGNVDRVGKPLARRQRTVVVAHDDR